MSKEIGCTLKLREEGRANIEELSFLFYHGYIKDALMGLDETDLDKVDEDFVMRNIGMAKEIIDERIKAQIAEEVREELRGQEAITSAVLEKKKQESETIADKRWIGKITREIQKERISAEKRAKKWANIGALVLTLLIIGVIIGIYFILLCAWKDGIGLYGIILTLVGAGSIIGIWKKSKVKIKECLKERILRNRAMSLGNLLENSDRESGQ